VTGELRSAIDALRRAQILHEPGNEYQEGVTLQYLGALLTTMGDYRASHVALARSLLIFTQLKNSTSEGITRSRLSERSLLLDDAPRSAALANHAWELARHDRQERHFIQAALLQGRAARGLGDLCRADERLHHALTRTRAVNDVELELPALIAIAELELSRRHPTQARASLEDVWEAAERGPYRLHQANAYNVLVDIAQAQGDTQAAITAATKAYTAAWCDGPPYAYHWGLQKAKAHLTALGAPEPDMPPFDESKFEPLPEVEINPKDEFWVDPDKLDDAMPR
jgi:tetratricopeptide (TPR) repeat protein